MIIIIIIIVVIVIIYTVFFLLMTLKFFDLLNRVITLLLQSNVDYVCDWSSGNFMKSNRRKINLFLAPGMLSSPARTLGSWVRIPLKSWMFICVYSVFVWVAALRWADPPSKESYRLS
jgi:hypothetical protein